MRRLIDENMFIVYSLSCAICFGVHNYITAVAMHKWRNSISVLYPEFISLMLVNILYHAYRAYTVVKPKTGGRIWSKALSVFYKKDGTFNRLALVILIIRALAADVIPINIAMITYTCKQISISPAVVQSFTTLSSFMTAVGFYYSYGERLTYQHIAGMLMIVGSVLIVAVAKSMEQSNVSNELY